MYRLTFNFVCFNGLNEVWLQISSYISIMDFTASPKILSLKVYIQKHVGPPTFMIDVSLLTRFSTENITSAHCDENY